MQQEKQKRRPGFPITINKNVDEVKAKVHTICSKHNISVSALFDAVVDGLTDEQWAAFADEAQRRKEEKAVRTKLNRLGYDLKDVVPAGKS